MAQAVVDPPVVAFTAAVTGLFDDAGDLAVWTLPGDELDTLIEAQLALLSRMRAQLLASVAQAQLLDRPGAVDAPGMRPWLRGRFGVSPAFAGRLLHEAAVLARTPAAAEAARAGTIATEVAVEVGQAVTDLPPELGADLRGEAELLLLGFATGSKDTAALDAIGIRYVGRHLMDLLDPDTADRLLGDRLEREAADTHRRRFLSLTPDGAGGVRLRGLFTAEAGATLAAVLQPLVAPAHDGGDRAAAPRAGADDGRAGARTPGVACAAAETAGAAEAVGPAGATGAAGATSATSATGATGATGAAGATGATGATGAAGATSAAGATGAAGATNATGAAGAGAATVAGAASADPGSQSGPDELMRDDRTGGQRLADALVEVAQRLLVQGDLPAGGGERPHLLVTIASCTIGSGTGPAAVLPDGTELPLSDVRRLACDAGIIPAVLGGAGQVLDLGRTSRTATPAQRRALGLRDRGCAFPNCDRPPSWCEAHHIREWEHLGPTDLANLVLLCGYHHRTLHREHWTISAPTDGLRPLFVPPAWIDPRRRPRRNALHHPRELLHPAPPS